MVSWGMMHVLVVAVAGPRNLGVGAAEGKRHVSAKSMLLLAWVRIAETPQPESLRLDKIA